VSFSADGRRCYRFFCNVSGEFAKKFLVFETGVETLLVVVVLGGVEGGPIAESPKV